MTGDKNHWQHQTIEYYLQLQIVETHLSLALALRRWWWWWFCQFPTTNLVSCRLEQKKICLWFFGVCLLLTHLDRSRWKIKITAGENNLQIQITKDTIIFLVCQQIRPNAESMYKTSFFLWNYMKRYKMRNVFMDLISSLLLRKIAAG